MKKGKVVRMLGFVGALGVTTALVTTAVQGTGAYFTSTVNGTMTAKTGHLQVISTSSSLDFSGLNPGQDKPLPINYRISTDSTTNADVWLVFNPKSAAFGAFSGAQDATYYDEYWDPNAHKWNDGTAFTTGGLGQYGHFKVTSSTGATLFQSYNLSYDKSGSEMDARLNQPDSCNVNADGIGGSSAQHALGQGNDINWCGVPAAILLQKNVAPSANLTTATITFGVTGKMSAQDTAEVNVPFQIVATQPGQYPLVRNGNSKATDPQGAGTGHVGTNW